MDVSKRMQIAADGVGETALAPTALELAISSGSMVLAAAASSTASLSAAVSDLAKFKLSLKHSDVVRAAVASACACGAAQEYSALDVETHMDDKRFRRAHAKSRGQGPGTCLGRTALGFPDLLRRPCDTCWSKFLALSDRPVPAFYWQESIMQPWTTEYMHRTKRPLYAEKLLSFVAYAAHARAQGLSDLAAEVATRSFVHHQNACKYNEQTGTTKFGTEWPTFLALVVSILACVPGPRAVDMVLSCFEAEVKSTRQWLTDLELAVLLSPEMDRGLEGGKGDEASSDTGASPAAIDRATHRAALILSIIRTAGQAVSLPADVLQQQLQEATGALEDEAGQEAGADQPVLEADPATIAASAGSSAAVVQSLYGDLSVEATAEALGMTTAGAAAAGGNIAAGPASAVSGLSTPEALPAGLDLDSLAAHLMSGPAPVLAPATALAAMPPLYMPTANRGKGAAPVPGSVEVYDDIVLEPRADTSLDLLLEVRARLQMRGGLAVDAPVDVFSVPTDENTRPGQHANGRNEMAQRNPYAVVADPLVLALLKQLCDGQASPLRHVLGIRHGEASAGAAVGDTMVSVLRDLRLGLYQQAAATVQSSMFASTADPSVLGPSLRVAWLASSMPEPQLAALLAKARAEGTHADDGMHGAANGAPSVQPPEALSGYLSAGSPRAGSSSGSDTDSDSEEPSMPYTSVPSVLADLMDGSTTAALASRLTADRSLKHAAARALRGRAVLQHDEGLPSTVAERGRHGAVLDCSPLLLADVDSKRRQRVAMYMRAKALGIGIPPSERAPDGPMTAVDERWRVALLMPQGYERYLESAFACAAVLRDTCSDLQASLKGGVLAQALTLQARSGDVDQQLLEQSKAQAAKAQAFAAALRRDATVAMIGNPSTVLDAAQLASLRATVSLLSDKLQTAAPTLHKAVAGLLARAETGSRSGQPTTPGSSPLIDGQGQGYADFLPPKLLGSATGTLVQAYLIEAFAHTLAQKEAAAKGVAAKDPMCAGGKAPPTPWALVTEAVVHAHGTLTTLASEFTTLAKGISYELYEIDKASLEEIQELRADLRSNPSFLLRRFVTKASRAKASGDGLAAVKAYCDALVTMAEHVTAQAKQQEHAIDVVPPQSVSDGANSDASRGPSLGFPGQLLDDTVATLAELASRAAEEEAAASEEEAVAASTPMLASVLAAISKVFGGGSKSSSTGKSEASAVSASIGQPQALQCELLHVDPHLKVQLTPLGQVSSNNGASSRASCSSGTGAGGEASGQRPESFVGLLDPTELANLAAARRSMRAAVKAMAGPDGTLSSIPARVVLALALELACDSVLVGVTLSHASVTALVEACKAVPGIRGGLVNDVQATLQAGSQLGLAVRLPPVDEVARRWPHAFRTAPGPSSAEGKALGTGPKALVDAHDAPAAAADPGSELSDKMAGLDVCGTESPPWEPRVTRHVRVTNVFCMNAFLHPDHPRHCPMRHPYFDACSPEQQSLVRSTARLLHGGQHEDARAVMMTDPPKGRQTKARRANQMIYGLGQAVRCR